MQDDKPPQETIAEEADDGDTSPEAEAEAEDRVGVFVVEDLESVEIQRLVLDGVCEGDESELTAEAQVAGGLVEDEDVDEESAFPLWMRTRFQPEQLEDIVALQQRQRLTDAKTETPCEECNKRRALLQCTDCAQLLCFTCADAIHIVPVLASHGISLLPLEPVDAEQWTRTLDTIVPQSPPLPPPAQPPSSIAPASPTIRFTPATQIEHRMHLPIGTKLFFRVEDCGRWRRELLHGSVVGLNHGVRSTTSSTTSDALSFYYRVLWLRGVEALANGFFRATLMLPTPFWPVEIGLFPSQLSAFRAVLTAEKLARAKLRRERVSGRWHESPQHQYKDRKTQEKHEQDAFPSAEIVNEILDETEGILGQEFRTRLTHNDDAAFLQEVGRGQWQFAAWMAHIGRESELREEAAAIQELDDELLAMERTQDTQLSKLAELLLLWSPRGRMRFFLVEQTELLLPEPLQRVHIASIIQQMLFVYVGFTWQRWCHFTKRHRRHERKQHRERAATRLQTWWLKTLKRIEEAKTQQLLKAMASPQGALELYRKRQLCAAKLYAFVSKQYEDKQRRALQAWAAYTKVLAAHGVGGPVVIFPESPGTWHPSHGITSLPRLPRMYAHKKPNGSVAIDDLKLYKQFHANHAGPTESSYWILRHRVLAGVYPVGTPAFRDARRIVARADYTMSVLLQEIGTFVCLAEPSELQSHEPNVDASCLVQYQQQQRANRKASSSIDQQAQSQSPRPAPCQTPWLFERIVRAKHEALSVELAGAAKLSERHLQLAQSELDEFLSSVPVVEAPSSSNSLLLSDEARAHRETLTNKVTLAQQSVRKAQETLAQLKPLDFLEFPIPKDGVPVDVRALESFLVLLEDRLRRQERLYVFSMQGHGRTGFLAALLLGRLYGLTATEALDRAQRLHDCQVAMHGVGATHFVSSPHAAPQITMVTQLLARFNDAIYAPVVSENSEQQFVAWRAQQRGQPIEKFVAKDGFMVSDRVDDTTQALQQREWHELQRIAKRESQATKLRFTRQRQEKERHAMEREEADVVKAAELVEVLVPSVHQGSIEDKQETMGS